MTGRVRLATLGALLLCQPLSAQVPVSPQPPQAPSMPVAPGEPRTLPPNFNPAPPQQPTEPEGPFPQPDPSVQLPLREDLRPIDHPTVTIRQQSESWQLWAGRSLMRDFGPNRVAAEEALRTVRELRPTEWATVGAARPVVDYALTNGKPATWAPNPKWSVPVDLKSVRAMNVRGAWVVQDDANIILNFGTDRPGAEQAAAVARKYGFNRVGMVGFPTPAMAYFYAAPVLAQQNKGPDPTATLARVAQENQLTRTGVAVPGVGFVGERLVIDSRKVEVRKDRGEFVLAHGPDVLARFGHSEWAARDAQKVVRDCRFTEFCTVSPGATFFLVNGAAPTRVPFSAQGTKFDPQQVKARPFDGRWGVFEGGGRMLFPAATKEEAEHLVRVVHAYQFDQICQVGLSPRASLKFLAKTGR
ncbi:MAG TPA: hypothetical protein VM533_06775 [Fimbriiglobus sp.]|nr:hypothetical protein [Fimbriiglobus sp.]